MAKETTEEQFRKLLPNSIDDIVREHRDELRLALATDAELKALETTLNDGPVTHRISGWNVLILHMSSERGQLSSPRLSGTVVDTRESWITSHVLGIDFRKGLVQTKNSFYRITGPRAAEEDVDLFRICASLHEWRLWSPLWCAPYLLLAPISGLCAFGTNSRSSE